MRAGPAEPAAGGLRLLCLPPAGGSAAVFRRWRRKLPARLEVVAVDRGPAPDEPAAATLIQTAQRLAESVPLDRPYALVGHSLGGLIAYEAAARIAYTPGVPPPQFVAVLGCRPPHRSSADVFAPLLGLGDTELLTALADLGAVNSALLTSPLRNLFMPALRADLALVAGYRPVSPGPVPIRLLAWHGVRDDLAPPDLGAEWAGYTTAEFELRAFDGGHFFPYELIDDVVSALVTHPLAA